MDRHRISETHCTCPSHDEDDYCKHVAAVLYAIQHEQDGEDDEEEDEKEKEIPAHIVTKLEQLRQDELLRIIKIALPGEDVLIQVFNSLADRMLLRRNANDLAAELIEKIRALAKDDMIDEDTMPAVEAHADNYIDLAEGYWKKRNVKVAFDYLFAVTEVWPIIASLQEEYSTVKCEIMQRALNTIHTFLSKKKIDEKVREILTERALAGAADPEIPLAAYQMHWLDLIVRHGLAFEDEEEMLEILDEQLAETEGEEPEVFARLLRLKIDFLNNQGQKSAAMKLVAGNPAVANEKEQLILSASKKNGEYKGIKEKMLAELELARVNGEGAQYERLQKTIIELMMSKSDVLDLRKLAEKFYKETGDGFFYEAMKGTYMNAEWEAVKHNYRKPGNPLVRV